MRFKNREHAAHLLVDRLSPFYKNKNPLVLGIPRGAVPMAGIIADGLGGEIDVVLVRKLGHPDQPEFAIGVDRRERQHNLMVWAMRLKSTRHTSRREKTRQLSIMRERRARYTPWRAPAN